jgi:hypothetical protein
MLSGAHGANAATILFDFASETVPPVAASFLKDFASLQAEKVAALRSSLAATRARVRGLVAGSVVLEDGAGPPAIISRLCSRRRLAIGGLKNALPRWTSRSHAPATSPLLTAPRCRNTLEPIEIGLEKGPFFRPKNVGTRS